MPRWRPSPRPPSSGPCSEPWAPAHEHDEIIDAILAGDPVAAECRMRTHMDRFASVFAGALPELLDETIRWE